MQFPEQTVMFEQIFLPSPDIKEPTPIRPRKGVIIGVGQVGIACAYSLLIQDCFDELILQDIDRDRVEGEVMDLQHGIPLLPPTTLKAGTVADEGQDADIVIITAGAAQKEGETRLDLLCRNVKIYESILADVVKYCPNAILLIVSNPVDIMTYITLKISNFPPSRVIGSGTVLDSARLRSIIAKKLDIDARSVHAYIIGEHGDSEVPVWSCAHVGGTPLLTRPWKELSESDRASLDEIFCQVKNAAYEIIRRKGYTSYAIGLSVTDIVQAILRSQERILTVSSLLNGPYGIENVCLSLPKVVSDRGILKVVNLALSDREREQVIKSAEILRSIASELKL
jgi:L-lactate dehydrogenase